MDAMCIGMAVSDIMVRGWSQPPLPGHTLFVPEISVGVGGDALNQSIGLAKLGHDVALVTLVGDDVTGRLIIDSAAQEGVDTSFVVTTDTLPTSTTVVLIGADGERSFVSQRGATADACGSDHFGPDLLPDGVKVLSVGSLFCSEGLDRGVLPALLAAAHRQGTITVADMVTDRAGAVLDDVADVLANVDYLVPSQVEAEYFTGKSDPIEAAKVLQAYGAGTVIIKRGAEGVVAVAGSQVLEVEALRVPVVDTTGSGDSFVAGFVSGLIDAIPLPDALRRGTASAALSIQALGATTASGTKAEVESLLRRLGPVPQPLAHG